VDDALKAMVAHMSSAAAGCLYCEAHTAATASGRGVEDSRIEAIWEFEHDPRFTGAERAALRLARDAAQVPNAVTPEHFEELQEFFDDGEIVELVGVIATFGFLNRWNDTFATTLEQHPMMVAERALAGRGWQAGKHGTA
jgi:alkylhydroperoxidase family enzyme